MTDRTLRMVRLQVDGKRLISFAGGSLPRGHDDLPFMAHGLLCSLFGEGNVQPFRLLSEQSRSSGLLGYSSKNAEELRQHADEFADPLAHAAIDWDAFATKEMPNGWAEGRRLGFEVRTCPVVRLASAREAQWKNEKRSLPAGAEIDAFVHAKYLHRESGVSREESYSSWLQRRLDDAAAITDVTLASFRRLRLVRRTHGSPRRAHLLERPEAILKGVLVVKDPAAFRNVLTRGIGRHRTYGFGMVLLHPIL